MKSYSWEFKGTAADGQTWSTSGQILDASNDPPGVFMKAFRESFNQLTGGKAVFGKPGVGCRGPYNITDISIKQVDT